MDAKIFLICFSTWRYNLGSFDGRGKQHQNTGAIWTVLKDHVYNIYPYIKFPPWRFWKRMNSPSQPFPSNDHWCKAGRSW